MTTPGPVPWTLQAMLVGIDHAMLITQVGNGRLNSRPVMTQRMEADGRLWFFDHRDTPTSIDICGNPRIQLSVCESRRGFISIDGHAELVLDRACLRARWSPVHYQWFAQGLGDPDLALVRVTVERAVSWQPPLGRHGRLLPVTADATSGDRHTLGWEAPFPTPTAQPINLPKPG